MKRYRNFRLQRRTGADRKAQSFIRLPVRARSSSDLRHPSALTLDTEYLVRMPPQEPGIGQVIRIPGYANHLGVELSERSVEATAAR